MPILVLTGQGGRGGRRARLRGRRHRLRHQARSARHPRRAPRAAPSTRCPPSDCSRRPTGRRYDPERDAGQPSPRRGGAALRGTGGGGARGPRPACWENRAPARTWWPGPSTPPASGAQYRFVEVNCAALPDNLLEAEIFGYEKGAFTDARKAKRGPGGGRRRRARSSWTRSGRCPSAPPGQAPDVPGVAASPARGRDRGHRGATCASWPRPTPTSRARYESGAFREDLYYRLNVAQIVLPALREIRSDIELLARHFVRRSAEYFGKPVPELDARGVERLGGYDWPGNVRELRNVIERALIFSKGADPAGGSLRARRHVPGRPRGSSADGAGMALPPGSHARRGGAPLHRGNPRGGGR